MVNDFQLDDTSMCFGGSQKLSSFFNGRQLADAEEENQQNLSKVEEKFPVLEWTPQLDDNGDQSESLLYHNTFIINTGDGEKVEDLYLSDT